MDMGSVKDAILPISNPNTANVKHNRPDISKRGAFAAISYMSCAVLLIMFNKAALSSYSFPSANVITLFQMICSCLFLYVLKRWKAVKFVVSESSNNYENCRILVPLKSVRSTLPLSVTYLLYMITTMESVRGVNVPMYTTLRRTTVVFAMLMEYVLVGQKYTFSVVCSVGVIIFGAFVAGIRDLSFDSHGYAIVLISNVATAIYLATIARIGKSSGLNSFGLMWCNGIICIPFLLLWTYLRGDIKLMIRFPYLLSTGFLVVLLFSCILAFFLNYSIFLNTTVNSPLTQTICGNLKDIFTVGVGWIVFGGLVFDILNVVGQMLGFAGSIMYAYYKLKGK